MRRQLNYASFLLSFALALLIASCASLPAPKTFNEKAAAAYTGATAIRSTTLSLLQAHKLSPDDAENANEQADNIRAAIEIARQLKGTNSTLAEDKLTLAITGLTALQACLDKAKSKGGGT